MRAYFFNIEKDNENKDIPVLEDYQALSQTTGEWQFEWNPIVGSFDYDIQTGELIFIDWIKSPGAAPA